MDRHLTCIVCPKGCDITVSLGDDGKVLSVAGNTCRRGAAYAENECTAPKRTVTSTVALAGGGVLPVKTAGAIPKELVFRAMDEIRRVTAPEGTKIGDVLIEDLLGTGIAVVATKNA